ncbi:hypothetical protein T03_4536 [Trichinella britovi]|uniref:Uncharacterized protein n=1 Tax=Trichinella britovi TaxID=45882 RepID=A0A0V1CUM5_TRIBR|nr:hypothetical protein T03_4536 [Trichinella britovi]
MNILSLNILPESDSVRLAVLCRLCDREAYSIIKLLTSPDSPSSKTFDEVMKLLRNYFSPKPSEVYQRELRYLAQHCDFGETLESRVRAQLICDLRDGNVRLITERLPRARRRGIRCDFPSSQIQFILWVTASYGLLRHCAVVCLEKLVQAIYAELFSDTLGTVKGLPVVLHTTNLDERQANAIFIQRSHIRGAGPIY